MLLWAYTCLLILKLILHNWSSFNQVYLVITIITIINTRSQQRRSVSRVLINQTASSVVMVIMGPETILFVSNSDVFSAQLYFVPSGQTRQHKYSKTLV